MSGLIYLASPYSHPNDEIRQQRFDEVVALSGLLISQGFTIFCPIAMSHPIQETGYCGGSWAVWGKIDKTILERCDALWVVTMPGYAESVGVQAEIAFAKSKNIPISFYHPEEQRLELVWTTPKPHSHLPTEFKDLLYIMDNGAKKHGDGTWLDPANPSLQHKSNCDSMFHHLAEHYAGQTEDTESGLHPLLHLACRALMAYTRFKRGIGV